MHSLLARIRRLLHSLDFLFVLPLLASLPIPVAYRLAGVRGWVHARLGIDWRTLAFGTDLRGLTAQAFREMLPGLSEKQVLSLVRQRYMAQAREEFEAHLVMAGKMDRLSCSFSPDPEVFSKRDGKRGLVLLTPHFGSFFLGYAFLCGLVGVRCNGMSSSVTSSPQVIPAVQRYYFRKYRVIESMMHGGCVLDQEAGLRPFYSMLRRGEVLLVLADLPAVSSGAAIWPGFLGKKRGLAGGAVRLARHTESDLGSYVCRFLGNGKYRIDFGPFCSPNDDASIDLIYQFFSDTIMENPGCWWAADLLGLMPEQLSGKGGGVEEAVSLQQMGQSGEMPG